MRAPRPGRGRGVAAARFIAWACAWACVLGVSAPALAADEYVSRANAAYLRVPADKRSDTLLLPAIAAMQTPPAGIETADRAAMLATTDAAWDQASAWAAAEPQQAVLAVLARVTRATVVREAYAFAQPYGIEGVPVEFVQQRLYTELGDPPTLAAAQLHYLDGLDRVATLVNVEATRLLEAEKASDAIDVLLNWVFFCRQMADRQMSREVDWGLRGMAQGMERVRDVAYQDLRGKRSMDVVRTQAQVKRVQLEGGYLDTGRVAYPEADSIGAEQVVARVYIPRGKVDPRTFASAMARLGSSEFPLRLFSESARWRNLADQQADWFDATEKLKGVLVDRKQRWGVQMWDNRFSLPSEYAKMDKARFAAIAAALPDSGHLYFRRLVANTETVGTQTSLALVGWTRLAATRGLPPSITVVRPQWVTELPVDPFNPSRASGAKPPLEYFVPMRDTPRTERQEPQPYNIEVVMPDGRTYNFPFKDDVFVVYSWGSDLAKNFARRVQNTHEKYEIGADYIIWPPMISLRREAQNLAR